MKYIRGVGTIQYASIAGGIATIIVSTKGTEHVMYGESRLVEYALEDLFEGTPIGRRVGYRRDGSMLWALFPVGRKRHNSAAA